tara:strand:- start:62497 stop:62850 length:354 start_codon:yes stop_codon:yes gene_type:complete
MHVNDENMTPAAVFASCSITGFIRMRIRYPKGDCFKHMLYFVLGNAMLAALRPIPLIPFKTRNLHDVSMHLCMYNFKRNIFRRLKINDRSIRKQHKKFAPEQILIKSSIMLNPSGMV